MTTARDIVRGAYQRLGLIALGADLDPDRAADGLMVYNGMLDAWQADGIFPGGPSAPLSSEDYFLAALGSYPPNGPSDASTPVDNASLGPFTLNDAFPFPAQFVNGSIALLACEMANAAGMEPMRSTQVSARKAYQALLAHFVIAPCSSCEAGLTYMPSQRRYGFR